MDEGTKALELLVNRFPRLADGDRQILGKWLTDFEAGWSPQQLARTAADLPGLDTPLRRPALFGTLLVDLRRRWESGKPIAVEQYLHQFPELASEGREIVGLLKEEFEIRKGLGHSVSIDQYIDRFPNYASAIRRWVGAAKPTDGEIDLDSIHETITPRAVIDAVDDSADGEPTDAHPTPTLQRDLTRSGNAFLAPAAPGAVAHSAPTVAGRAPTPVPDRPRESQSASMSASLPRGMVMGEIRGDFGRYKIVRRLGRGGMGTVFLALDTQLDRQVALKVPNFNEDSNGPALIPARFRQEARAAAGLSHPGICAVYDVGSVEGVHYITMAYVEGSALSQRLKGNKPLPVEEAVSLVRRIAGALAYAHGTGVIHRDLKPANIMMTPAGDPVVMDFGLARRSDEQGTRLTADGEVIGTMAYMPPEQLSGDLTRIGPHSDVYSLGCILYETLTGRLPFDGPPATLIMKLLREAPRPLGELQPHLVGSPLDAVIQKAMAKKVSDRYQSMAEFDAGLAAAVGDRPRIGFTTMPGDRKAEPEPTLARDRRPEKTLTPMSSVSTLSSVTPPVSLLSQPSSRKRVPQSAMLAAVLVLLAVMGGVAAWQFGLGKLGSFFQKVDVVPVPPPPDTVLAKGPDSKKIEKPPVTVATKTGFGTPLIDSPPLTTVVKPPPVPLDNDKKKAKNLPEVTTKPPIVEETKPLVVVKVVPVIPPPPPPPPIPKAEIDRWQKHLDAAREKLGKRNGKGALEDLAAAVRDAPDKARKGATLLQRARVGLDFTDYKSARSDADQVAVFDSAIGDEAALIAADSNRQLWDFPGSLAACDRFTSPAHRNVALAEANRALAYIVMQDWEKASAAVDLALDSWAECPTALLANASIAFFHDHDVERAEAILAQAIERSPDDPSLRILRAQVRTKLRCFDDAIKDCEEAIKRCLWLEPHVVRIQAKLARDRWAYMNANGKKYSPMEIDIARVIALGTPDTAAEWIHHATLYRLKNDFAHALEWCNKAVDLQPNAVPGLLARAAVQIDLREYPAAVDDCRKVLELSPENAQALYLLGQVSFRKNELDDALDFYFRAERAEPRFVLPIRGRSDVHKKRNELDKTIELCDYGLKIEPDQPSLYLNRAFAKAAKLDLTKPAGPDFDSAVRDYDKSIEFDSSNPTAFNNRGLLWAKKKDAAQNDFEKAAQNFTDAIRRGPGTESYLRNRAAAYYRLGRDVDAESDVREADRIKAGLPKN
jgi:serine/threonine protein kinase/tetratricopeptide (TPR) repeat protein